MALNIKGVFPGSQFFLCGNTLCGTEALLSISTQNIITVMEENIESRTFEDLGVGSGR